MIDQTVFDEELGTSRRAVASRPRSRDDAHRVRDLAVLSAILLAAAALNLWVELAVAPAPVFDMDSPLSDASQITPGGSVLADSAYRTNVPGANASQADMLAQQTADFGAYGLAKTVEAAATASGLTPANANAIATSAATARER